MEPSSIHEPSRLAELPRDGKLIALILKSMGIDDFEPRVVHYLLEFMHRYVAEVIQDAQLYADHADRKNVELSDVRLAIQTKVNSSFLPPPSRQMLLELSAGRNAIPLPPVSPRSGIPLPPEKYCLTQPNYQIVSNDRV